MEGADFKITVPTTVVHYELQWLHHQWTWERNSQVKKFCRLFWSALQMKLLYIKGI